MRRPPPAPDGRRWVTVASTRSRTYGEHAGQTRWVVEGDHRHEEWLIRWPGGRRAWRRSGLREPLTPVERGREADRLLREVDPEGYARREADRTARLSALMARVRERRADVVRPGVTRDVSTPDEDERALLAGVMPLVIAKTGITVAEESWLLQLTNIGRSTALNIILRDNGTEFPVDALAPGQAEAAIRSLTGDEPVTIEYEDPAGNRYQTVCSPPDPPHRQPMYKTSYWVEGRWRPLKAT